MTLQYGDGRIDVVELLGIGRFGRNQPFDALLLMPLSGDLLFERRNLAGDVERAAADRLAAGLELPFAQVELNRVDQTDLLPRFEALSLLKGKPLEPSGCLGRNDHFGGFEGSGGVVGVFVGGCIRPVRR